MLSPSVSHSVEAQSWNKTEMLTANMSQTVETIVLFMVMMIVML